MDTNKSKITGGIFMSIKKGTMPLAFLVCFFFRT